MAIIYSYPVGSAKLSDLIIFTQTYDVEDVNPVVGNPTKTTTLSQIQSIIAPTIAEGTVNNMAMFSTTNKVVDAAPVSMIQSTVNGGTLLIGGNVDAGEFQLSTGQVVFDQSPTGSTGVGVLRWNNTDGTLDLGLKGGNVTLQIGQELTARVVNKSGVELNEANYQVVQVLGSQGQRLSVELAQANGLTAQATLGVVTETIPNNQEGFITTNGLVRGIDTRGQGVEDWQDGDPLYLSATVLGGLTNIKPIAPSQLVKIGFVINAALNGSIYVKIEVGTALTELYDVSITNPTENNLLSYNAAENIWVNLDLADIDVVTTASAGVANYITKFNSASTVSPSNLLYDDGTGIGINTTVTNEVLNIEGKIALNNSINSVSIGKTAGGTGLRSVAIGSAVLSASTGGSNTAIGYSALTANTTGFGNVAVGYALFSNTIGDYNVANGYQALFLNTSGTGNIAIGRHTLQNNTTANYNIAIGYRALQDNTQGTFNVANGYEALRQSTIGSYNVANGYQALFSNTSGNNNVAIGRSTLSQAITGLGNTAIGAEALRDNLSNYNTAVGHRALQLNTTGISNVAYGYTALAVSLTGNGNTAIGQAALSKNIADFNVAVGNIALAENTTGEDNTAVGAAALGENITGNSNTSIGNAAARDITTGSRNTVIGDQSLRRNLTGGNNVAVGYQAGSIVVGGGLNTIPETSVFIGNNTISATDNDFNQIVIGNGAVGQGSSTAVIGDASISALYIGGFGAGVVLKSPSGTKYKITVTDAGAIIATAI